MSKPADLLLFGATGFTGQRVARRLAQRAPAHLELAWCGRDRVKLERLAQEIGRGQVVVADAQDQASVRRAVEGARVVLNTAGPFARLGDPVVAACVEWGRHYADITGEVAWVRSLIDAHHQHARARGTFVVPCSGFDSVPADLGVYALVDAARQLNKGDLAEVLGVYRLRGGLNGGSWATALDMAERNRSRDLMDPYLLVPGYTPSPAELKRQRDPLRATREPGKGTALIPFFMGPINRRVVMRSDALLRYGSALVYREYMPLGSGSFPLADGVAAVQRALGLVLGTGWGRALGRRLGPAPGSGPSEVTIEQGHVQLDLYATSVEGQHLALSLDATGDPGNAVTSRCLVECGLMLAETEAIPGLGRPGQGGVLTPASAFGLPLLARLQQHAGFSVRWIANP
jgi:short subunit dehydrogenase-like uncharacterized protein